MIMGFITEDAATVFHCKDCNKVINTEMENCRFCGIKINREEARERAKVLQTINFANNDASNLKMLSYGFIAIAVPWKHFKLGDIAEKLPFSKVPLKSVGAILLFIPFLIMWFRWQKNYGKLRFSDIEFLEAKKSKDKAMLIAVAGIVAVIIIDMVITIIILRLENGSRWWG